MGTQPADSNGTGQLNAGEWFCRGRPVLTVPDEVEFLKLKNIVVAWKDTREARRAINDALPLCIRRAR